LEPLIASDINHFANIRYSMSIYVSISTLAQFLVVLRLLKRFFCIFLEVFYSTQLHLPSDSIVLEDAGML